MADSLREWDRGAGGGDRPHGHLRHPRRCHTDVVGVRKHFRVYLANPDRRHNRGPDETLELAAVGTRRVAGGHGQSAADTHSCCPVTSRVAVRAPVAGLTGRRDCLLHQSHAWPVDLLRHHVSPGFACVQGGPYPRLPVGPVQHLRVPRRVVRTPVALPFVG